ncbi:MAG TPA: non-homologous end-joining DNA ligase [Terriglobales bacterium]|nr:non-homologous end-joining DNA ligase [Terriglobales bacterium]
MALEEYKRKRDFKQTPEPLPKLEKKAERRFVVQKHHASHLHFDFRLEMEGVLKSWAVPKGPPLDPTEKRLAMMVEDHPVSYFHFEGRIPEGNYGAGTVMVWDTGTWEPVAAEPGAKPDASAMLEKGDLKFILHGKKLNGEFVLAHMKSHRPGSKGNEWLLIKKKDKYVKAGFNANDDKNDYSVLTKRSLAKIAADEGSEEWQSDRSSAKSSSTKAKKKDWLKPSLAKVAKRASAAKPAARAAAKKAAVKKKPESVATKKSSGTDLLKQYPAAEKTAMPSVIRPMLATLVDAPFNDADWLFEVKLDGYRAVAFVKDGATRFVSRTQNEMTADFPELSDLPAHLRGTTAILDGEICALDDQGRPSFSLMQQRTGFETGRIKRRTQNGSAPIVYYAFDILYLDGHSLMRVDLEDRKEILRRVLIPNEVFHFSEHFKQHGIPLFEVARQKSLEGIIAKRRKGCYLQKRTREWLKIKITQRQECVIGGYTEPRGSREHFGSLLLGLYDEKGRLIPVGQAGTGFTRSSEAEVLRQLRKLETDKSPFAIKPDSSRGLHFVKPHLVAEIKFTEWTHEGQKGGIKMRAPVFQGLRIDKKPTECIFEVKKSAVREAAKAGKDDAA